MHTRDRYGLHRFTVRETKTETNDIKTFIMDGQLPVEAGQFVMVWLPGQGEVPMTPSYISKDIGITVRNVGNTTAAIHALRKKDRLWMRGPYGQGFALRGKELLFVAGGTGISSIAPMVELARKDGASCTAAIGGKTAGQVFMAERLERCGTSVTISTDDGSLGEKGTAADAALRLLSRKRFDDILMCGPELMMAKVAERASKKGIPFQASLERYVKCGLGICDSCVIGPYHICKDGPVFTDVQLAMCPEFGKERRGPSGAHIGF